MDGIERMGARFGLVDPHCSGSQTRVTFGDDRDPHCRSLTRVTFGKDGACKAKFGPSGWEEDFYSPFSAEIYNEPDDIPINWTPYIAAGMLAVLVAGPFVLDAVLSSYKLAKIAAI